MPVVKHSIPLTPFLLSDYLPEVNTTLKTTVLSADALKMWLRAPLVDSLAVCGIDIETYPAPGWEHVPGAALNAYSARIRTVQIDDGENNVLLDFMLPDRSNLLHTDKEVLGNFCNFLNHHAFAAHNAQFEVEHFTRLLEMNRTPSLLRVHCTRNAYRLILQADDWKWKLYDGSLQGVARRVLGFNVDKEISHERWAVPGLDEEQIRYCAIDAFLPRVLLGVLFENLKTLDMVEYFKLYTKLYNVIGHMRLFGNPINEQKHTELLDGWKKELNKARADCFALLNSDNGFDSEDAGLEFVLQGVSAKALDGITYQVKIYMAARDWSDPYDLHTLQAEMEHMAKQEGDAAETRALKKVAANIKERLVSPGSDKQLSDWIKVHVEQEVLNEWAITDGSVKYVEKCHKENVPIDPAEIRFKMDAETFDDIGDLDVIEPLSRYKKYSKLVSTYGETLKNFYVRTPWNALPAIHAQYTTCYTETGRLSTYKPSAHQIPREKNVPSEKRMRSMFCSRGPGYEFVSGDLSQVELRAQAYITGDPVMIEIYEQGLDIHNTTAAGILAFAGKSREMVSEDEWDMVRDASKNVNFGCQYGGGAAAAKKGGRKSGVKLEMANWQTFVDGYRFTYPTARQYQLEQARITEQTLKVRVPYGKLCSLHPEFFFTQGLNYPVQGAAFVVLAIALVELYKIYCESPHLDFRILKTVHDSIDIDCKKEHVEQVKTHLQRVMEIGMLTVFPMASLVKLVDIKVGPNWGDLH